VAGCREYGNEPSGSIKCGEFDCLRICELLKNEFNVEHPHLFSRMTLLHGVT